MSYTRYAYGVAALAVIVLGIASRVFVTGNILFDKYLGDALYAILLYLILRLWNPKKSVGFHAIVAMVWVFVIECFQLTGIPASMRQRDSLPLRMLSIALGTQFSWYDVLAYAFGILAAYGFEVRRSYTQRKSKVSGSSV